MSPILRRLLLKCKVEDTGYESNCWLWQGETDRNGYGRIKRDGKYVPTHWVALGDPPEGQEVDHKCLQRSCVRPSHLEYVSRQENMKRRWSKSSNE